MSNRKATVSIPVSGMVWFINNAAGAGDGRLSSPFNTLAAFQAVNDGVGNHPAANDNIFIYESGTAYTGPITLLSGQKLIGQDATASLSAITGLTPQSGSASFPPMNSGNGTVTNLGGTVTLNTNTTVRGLSISSSSSTGMTDPAGAITGVNVSEVDITTTTGTAVNFSNIAGTLSFDGLTTTGGTGASLTGSNGSATFNFTGVSISSGANAGFSSTGGGTVNVTGSSNTITSTTGTALNVTNTTIGASGLTFLSINAQTASANPGIVLNNTGTGALTVTGTRRRQAPAAPFPTRPATVLICAQPATSRSRT